MEPGCLQLAQSGLSETSARVSALGGKADIAPELAECPSLTLAV
jgi:hypothetical protein